jgi:hypothetical protein
VRPNAATEYLARDDAAYAARDVDAFSTLLAESAEVIDHSTGATYGRPETLAFFRTQLRAQGLTHQNEPLATLGNSLALYRMTLAASGAAGSTFDVGAYEFEHLMLIEVDAQGLRQRLETFADNHLGEAVARLYERYAELLSEGPERDRAAATARSVAAMTIGPIDRERIAEAIAVDVEYVDRQTLGLPSAHGSRAFLQGLRILLDLTEGAARRVDDVLCLQSDRVLVRCTGSGTARATGGAYERQYISLFVFGADGLLTRWEQFDADREAEALARFDELTAEPVPVMCKNSADLYAALR